MLLHKYNSDDLSQIAESITEGRLAEPFTEAGIARLGLFDPQSVAAELLRLVRLGFQSPQIATLLHEVADERRWRVNNVVTPQLVVSGPDVSGLVRDTAVVVQQLFNEARSSVLMVWYALYDGRTIFRTLANRMDEDPALKVTLCLDVSRRGTDTTRDADIADRFARGFVNRDWPGRRLPEVYFDPRALTSDPKTRAVLHAKCIVIDGRKALVTSANPTPAAYNRNIEVGLVLDGAPIPLQIEEYFGALIQTGLLKRLHLR